MQRAHELMAAQLAGASNPSTPLSGPRLAGCCAALRILALLEGMGHSAYVAKFSGPLVKLCYGIAAIMQRPANLYWRLLRALLSAPALSCLREETSTKKGLGLGSFAVLR